MLCKFCRASVTQYLFLVGIEYTSATFSCAFLNMVPVITFLMALPFGYVNTLSQFVLEFLGILSHTEETKNVMTG